MELLLECQSRMPISPFLGWISSVSVIPEMWSLSVFLGERSYLVFWQKCNFIFVGKRNTTITNIQKTSYFHAFFEKDHLSFSVRKKNIIFSGKTNAIFPHDKRKIIFQCNFFGKTLFSEHLKNISYFHVFFWERSSFIFRLKNNIIFSEKRNIIFPDDTRKIIFQCDFFWKDHLFRTLGKKYGFSCSDRVCIETLLNYSCRWNILRFNTGWEMRNTFSSNIKTTWLDLCYLMFRDYFSQILLCVGIIMYQNVLWLGIIFPSVL